MVIILPPFEDGSLGETVSRMTPENVQGVMAEIKSGFYKADDLTIQIPKFGIEQVYYWKFVCSWHQYWKYYHKQDIYISFIILIFQSMDLAQTLGQLGLKTLFDPLRSNLTNFISEESQQSDRVSFNR